jgi:large subunit ribosomal protein L10
VALNLNDKKAIVAEVSEVANQSISLVVADYSGIDVPNLTQLRSKARDSDVYLRVVRNTLAKRALQGTQFECVDNALVGPIIFGFAKNEPGAAAKLFKEFAKDNKALEVKALAVGGEYYEASQLDMVAALPTRDEALGMLARTLQAPITNLARTLAEPGTKLTRALDAYRQSKES